MIKPMIYADSFYPKDPKILEEMFENFEKFEILDNFRYLIVPHAGYIYSGNVANVGYTSINFKPKKILLLAPSHNFGFEGLVQPKTIKGFETPFGIVKTGKIPQIPEIDEIVFYEHSVEVQMPFIKYYFPNSIVYPVVVGEIDDTYNLNFKDYDLVIISSDLSHYLSYDLAVKKDMQTIQYILNKDAYGFLEYGDACGKYPIYLVLKSLKDEKGVLLKYQNSGDVTEDHNAVVGYAAIGFK